MIAKGCKGTSGDDGTAEDDATVSSQAAAHGDKRNEGPCAWRGTQVATLQSGSSSSSHNSSSWRAYTRPGNVISPFDALSHSIFKINICGEFYSFPFLHMRELSPGEFVTCPKSLHWSAGMTDPQI